MHNLCVQMCTVCSTTSVFSSVLFSLFVFGCQYQCNLKTGLRNDLLCVEWDVKPSVIFILIYFLVLVLVIQLFFRFSFVLVFIIFSF